MAKSPLMLAIEQLSEERGLPVETIIETIEFALAAAYRKDYGRPRQIIRVKLNPDDIGKSEVFQVFNVIAEEEELVEEENQLHLADAKKTDKTVEVGGELIIALPPKEDFGRIAAMTAKQVIIQRLSEAERDILYKEFKDREGQIINGNIQQLEGRDVIVNVGKIQAFMPPAEQVKSEHYYIGQRLKVLVIGVEETSRGPKVIVSRAHNDFIRGLFIQEVPEIQASTVTIEGIAREAGSRTKISVAAHQEGLDPVGSCVGQRGIRVQAVLSEVGNEKIDIILWDTNPKRLIANALSPAKVDEIKVDEKTKTATVYVPDDQVSLAIGKGGQNVRLASKLTGWTIDIVKDRDGKKIVVDEKQSEEKQPKPAKKSTSKTTKVKSKKKTIASEDLEEIKPQEDEK